MKYVKGFCEVNLFLRICKNKQKIQVNVQETPVIKSVSWKRDDGELPQKFQVVTTVFCMEYSCETLEGYYKAINSATSLIEDGGYLVVELKRSNIDKKFLGSRWSDG